MKELTYEQIIALQPPIKRFWYRWRALQKDFPIDKKVVIRTKPHKQLYLYGSRSYGYCTYSEKKDRFTIWVERNNDVAAMVETLWHEYAHAMTWTKVTRNHCRRWTDAYGKIYRRYMDEEK